MDLRGASEAIQQREMIDRAMSGLNTCLPGIIDSFDSATQTATVSPAIMLKVTLDDVVSYMSLPSIIKVPVVFPFASNAGFALTIPIKAGDPCLLIFSQRCIDNWHQSGGVQPPEQDCIGVRHHDLTDAFAILAPSPLPNVLGAWNLDGIEIRNRSRGTRVTVLDDKVEIVSGTTTLTISESGVVTLIAPASVGITTPLLTVTGNLAVTGYIKDSVRKMSEDRTVFDNHTHGDPQGGTSGTPNQQE